MLDTEIKLRVVLNHCENLTLSVSFPVRHLTSVWLRNPANSASHSCLPASLLPQHEILATFYICVSYVPQGTNTLDLQKLSAISWLSKPFFCHFSCLAALMWSFLPEFQERNRQILTLIAREFIPPHQAGPVAAVDRELRNCSSYLLQYLGGYHKPSYCDPCCSWQHDCSACLVKLLGSLWVISFTGI